MDHGAAWDDGADAWYRRRLACFLDEMADGPDVRDALVEWFGARRTEFITWEDADRYHPEFESGGWVIDWNGVRRALSRATAECDELVQAEREAVACRSLEDWLTGLHSGHLEWSGPEEPFGGQLLSGRARQAFEGRAQRARIHATPERSTVRGRRRRT